MYEPPAQSAPIVIAANRGPNDFVWEDGVWVTRKASGGLVSMVTPLAQRAEVAWFCCVSEPPDALQAREGLFTTATDQADDGLHVIPVPLPAAVYHAYYGQISNEVLWMLQHNVVGPGGFEYLDVAHHAAWPSYLAANVRLASAIRREALSPTAFLVQDYHLYPLPALLRERYPDVPLLHFTHIPFPPPNVLRLLPGPWRRTILTGLLGSDVVGLQTEEDARRFLDSCEELLGAEVDRESAAVRWQGRQVRARVYAAGVDPDALRELALSPAVAAARERLRLPPDVQTIIRVDRLDPSKNQLVGFRAFARLLELHPELRGRVRFRAFLVPSRTDLRVYRAYRDEVYRVIEETNERFRADCGFDPIEVFYTNDRPQALAAMEECDALLVNSLADGMNLVAKEWAVLATRPGVLIVSETAGVWSEARDAALSITPLDLEGTAQAMAAALAMPLGERRGRLELMRKQVEGATAAAWLGSQLKDLGLDPALVDGDCAPGRAAQGS